MSYFINNQQKMYEIIFANRNKNYGAYAIRSNYGSTMLKSVSFMFMFFVSIMSGAYYLSHLNDSNTEKANILPGYRDEEVIIYESFQEDKSNDKPAPEERQESRSNPAQNTDNNNIVVSDSVPATNPTVDVNNTSVTVNTSSTAGTGLDIPGEGNTGGNKDGGKGDDSGDDKKPMELFGVDSEPEYEGGLRAIQKFLASTIRYPQEAKEVGAEGTLYVKFVVNENGKVESPEALNHLGYGLEEEGLRVVAKIPPFKKPGMKKGKPVKVYYQVPIRYKLN